MTQMVEIDDQTYQALELAARMSGCMAGDVVARLVAEVGSPRSPKKENLEHSEEGVIGIYAHYAGHHTQARYDTRTTRVDIMSGPLAGQSFKTPTGAARSVVAHYNPDVKPNRNGWTFWQLDDGSRRVLEHIR